MKTYFIVKTNFGACPYSVIEKQENGEVMHIASFGKEEPANKFLEDLRATETKLYAVGVAEALGDIQVELSKAKKVYPDPFSSQHEAYGVIKEELDELWDEIKKNEKNYDLAAQRKEAIQLAAMVVRLIVEKL